MTGGASCFVPRPDPSPFVAQPLPAAPPDGAGCLDDGGVHVPVERSDAGAERHVDIGELAFAQREPAQRNRDSGVAGIAGSGGEADMPIRVAGERTGAAAVAAAFAHRAVVGRILIGDAVAQGRQDGAAAGRSGKRDLHGACLLERVG